ncbi:MAG: DEAD/DEAH box helicase [Promethearchaeota archaeon]
MNLQLTYVPAKYWTKEASQFQLLTKAPLPPKNSSFFIMWLSNSDSSDDLNESYEKESGNKQIDKTISPLKQLEQTMGVYFPKIPAKKLLACELLLAHPYQMQHINPSLSELQDEHSPIEFPKQKFFQLRKTLAKIIPLPPAIKLLFQLQIIESKDRTKKILQYSESIKLWTYLTKFTMELLSRGNFVPMLRDVESNLFEGQWKIILKTQLDHQRFNTLLRQASWSGYNIPINIIPPHGSVKEYQTSGLWHPSYLFVEYIDTIGDYMIRESLSKKFLSKFSALYEYSPKEMQNACSDDPNTPWDLRFLHACISKHRLFQVTRFCDTPIPGILRNWVQNIQGFSFSYGLSFTFRLEYPKSEKSDWNLGFYLQPLHDPNYFIPLQELWGGILTHHDEYANVCDDESGLQEDTLRALGTSSKLFPPIKRALFGKAPSQVKLKAGEVMDFMRYSMYLLIQAGFNVVLPEEFAAQGQQRLSARLVIEPKQSDGKSTVSTNSSVRSNGGGVGSPQALFDMDSMLEFHWEGTIEGKTLTEMEFLELANAREPLIFWRDHWILVDQEDMENLRPIFEANTKIKGEIPYTEALKLGMVGGVKLGEGATQYEVVVEGDFSGVINQLEHIEEFIPIADPSDFQGTLRQYQQKGLTWLTHMTRLNFGICLADDMGLGKTIEVIAFLQKRQEDVPHALGSILIVCPTSVLFNWSRELRKFAPSLKVLTHHGPDRLKELEAVKAFSHKHTIILTTYGTMRNDIDFLEAISFAGVVLDESQNIKNYQALKTKASLRLNSQFRIALSGTPIENRLIELWTLFEFLNPGLLGKRAIFQRKFILPIERYHDEQSAEHLKKFIAPFILRRLKTDKNIIQDLPEKNEIKIYLELSPPQAALYTRIVQETLEEMEQYPAEDVKRRGLILKLLTFTKQICNHPLQFQHKPDDVVEILPAGTSPPPSTTSPPKDQSESEGSYQIGYKEFLHGSQKLERLSEMVEEILEEGEKILIFTQFKQMGDLLKSFLETKYKVPIGWFHGGVSVNRRRTLVDEFQSTAYDSMPILILSLRAGGTGLNLTQASTVFHFDRWWNPAVEDQATDRAYRIGQKNRVNVYKFIATGTIEEKIDQMLEEKRALAGAILSSKDETWITALSNKELKELFSLSQSTEVY